MTIKIGDLVIINTNRNIGIITKIHNDDCIVETIFDEEKQSFNVKKNEITHIKALNQYIREISQKRFYSKRGNTEPINLLIEKFSTF